MSIEDIYYDKNSKQDLAYEYLKEQIIKDILKSDTYINESDIALYLGISKTPVREAMQRLISEGLLVNNPSGGASVTKITLEDIMEIYELRAVLDGLAARLCALLITPQLIEELDDTYIALSKSFDENRKENFISLNRYFRQIYINGSNNEKLINLCEKYDSTIQRISRITYESDDICRKSIHWKKDILKALKEGNADMADNYVQNYVRNFKQIYIDLFLQKNNYPFDEGKSVW